MEKAVFTPDLVSGNQMVDAQHMELIETINKLYAAFEIGQNVDEALATLGFLAQYTMFHFGTEEKLMREHGYPYYETHKAVHDAFIETVKQLYTELGESGADVNFADRVEEVVTKWLGNHIRGMDLCMIEWIRENKQA